MSKKKGMRATISIRHVVERAPRIPKPGEVYGAVEAGVDIKGNSVTFRWNIYGRKLRGKAKLKS